MSEENKTPFYNEFGQVDNADAAHELAHVSDDQGEDARIRREKALKFQHETSKTYEAARHLKIMDAIKKEYPDAFIELTDQKGRRLLVVQPESNILPDGRQGRETWFTEGGIIGASFYKTYDALMPKGLDHMSEQAYKSMVAKSLSREDNPEINTSKVLGEYQDLDLSPLTELIQDHPDWITGQSYRVRLKDLQGKESVIFVGVTKFDLENPNTKDNLQRILEQAQAAGAEKKQLQEASSQEPQAEKTDA